jgi:heme/copper-type cytochrome/quinol oxidase subunit 1
MDSSSVQIKQKPYNLFLPAAALFLLASLFPLNQNSTFDLHLHDTYFIIAHTHFFWVLAIIALFMWVVYFFE